MTWKTRWSLKTRIVDTDRLPSSMKRSWGSHVLTLRDSTWQGDKASDPTLTERPDTLHSALHTFDRIYLLSDPLSVQHISKTVIILKADKNCVKLLFTIFSFQIQIWEVCFCNAWKENMSPAESTTESRKRLWRQYEVIADSPVAILIP